jgi:hypothetical protein
MIPPIANPARAARQYNHQYSMRATPHRGPRTLSGIGEMKNISNCRSPIAD